MIETISAEDSLISNMTSESTLFEVKIEAESEDEAESVTDLYRDHEIKEEMAIGPVLLQPAVYNYSTNSSEAGTQAPGRLQTNAIPCASSNDNGEPSSELRFVLKSVTRTYSRPGRNSAAQRRIYAPLPKKPRQVIKNDKTDQVKPQEEMKGNYSEEIASVVDLNKNSFTDIETKEKVKNEEPNKNVNLLKCNEHKILSNECICSDNDCKHSGENCILKAHVESYKETKQDNNLKCTEGPHQTGTQDPLEQAEQHKLSKHLNLKNYDTDEIMLKCSIFDYKTIYIGDLKQHLQRHSDNTYSCFFCRYICSEKTYLIKHLRAHTGEKPYSCSFCEYKCNSKSVLAVHLRTHTGEKPYSCSFCEYKSVLKSPLVKHLRTHTGEKPYSCIFCEYKSTTKGSVVRHLRIHTGDKPFSCSLCDYKCTCKSHLTIHLRTHTGKKPFSCNFCEYKCNSKSVLAVHLRTHTGEKPYSCSFCEYKSALKSPLVKHLRTHTGEKPYSCIFCEYKSTTKGSLVRHLRTHTGEKPYSCSFCKYKSTSKSLLTVHLWTHSGKSHFPVISVNSNHADIRPDPGSL